MLEFRVEWQEAPGVRDPLLARSWARLEIRVEGNPIQFLDTRAGSVRSGIYGSVFPLVGWIIENWWYLIHESVPSPHALDGARSMLDQDGPKYRSWIRRHNLIAAREGNALPDLTIFRDGNRISIVAVPDPESIHTPGRFITKRLFDVSLSVAQAGMRGLVEVVLGRLSEFASSEVDEVRANWAAIQDSEINEPELCRALAALGADPFDPDGLDEELIVLLQDRVLSLAEPIRQDLLEATSYGSLESDCTYLEALTTRLNELNDWGAYQPTQPSGSEPVRDSAPHVLGYQRATLLRSQLSMRPDTPIPELSNLKDTLRTRMGFVAQNITINVEVPGTRINGLVGTGDKGQHVLISNQSASSTQRFLFARALHQWFHVIPERGDRLLTHAHSWEQRASRAFAAEFLAPAEALKERLDQDPDVELQDLANEFQVSPWVIAHQMENHGLVQLAA
jgi:IrrE N-terminal-like domain